MCRNLVTHKVEWTRDVLEKAQNILTPSLCQLIRFTIHTQTMTHKGPWDEITWNTSIQLCLAPLQSRVCEPFFPSCSSHRLHIPGTVRAVTAPVCSYTAYFIHITVSLLSLSYRTLTVLGLSPLFFLLYAPFWCLSILF